MMLKLIHCLLPLALIWGGEEPVQEKPSFEQPVSVFLTELFAARAQLLIQDNPETIRKFYLDATQTSIYAFQHEENRSKYLKTWASTRGVKFTNAEASIRITRQLEHKETAKISLVDTLKLTYEYVGLNLAPQHFGVGTRHGLTLKKINGSWHVFSEWYSDPIDENPNLVPVQANKQPDLQPEIMHAVNKKYNRWRAVAYADKYAGGAWGAENEHKYNKKYKDYTHFGGDCTNFASQVIGDPAEGGGLPMTSSWYYRYKNGGSEAWVRTDSFKNFLVYRGYGRIVAKGSFKDLFKPNARFPKGAFAQLMPGDLITYEIEGDVDHFCILTGWDANGYPLVNSHSGDRFHVPWDLGWDKYTQYSLIHMKD
jgi:hypothetical protein